METLEVSEHLESIDHLNKSLISRLHALDIVIPYPTNTYVKHIG